MKTILSRLEEMPLNMLVRVAQKFKLELKIDETRESIIDRLEEVISDYLMEIEENRDINIDGGMAKYNLLADIEVPHEITMDSYNLTDKVLSFVTYINMILIDDNWCYIYWDLSQYDSNRIKKSPDFTGLELQVLYKRDSFGGDFLHYEEKDIISVNFNDVDRNFYQQYHYVYATCLLVATYQKGKQLLAVSGEVFLPHVTPLWNRYKLQDYEYKVLELSLGKTLHNVLHYNKTKSSED